MGGLTQYHEALAALVIASLTLGMAWRLGTILMDLAWTFWLAPTVERLTDRFYWWRRRRRLNR